MQHRMTLFVVSVLVGLWLWALPAFADGDGVRCQVTTPVLRVRSAPNEAQLGTAYGGTWLTATARNADPDGESGADRTTGTPASPPSSSRISTATASSPA